MLHQSIFAIIVLFSTTYLQAMDKRNSRSPKELSASQQSIAFPQQTSNTPTPIVITFNNAVTPEFNNRTESTSTSESQSSATAEAYSKVQNVVDIINTNLSNLPQTMQGLLERYRWHLIIGTPIISYLAVYAFILHGNAHINNQEAWGQWKRHLSTEELNNYYVSQKNELSKNLIDGILKRYFKTTAPTNHIEPLIQFMVEIEREMTIMNRYILVATILQKSSLIKLFPTDVIKLEQAKERQQRLQSIKHLFINSMASHNFNQIFQQATSSSMQPSAPTLVAAAAA